MHVVGRKLTPPRSDVYGAVYIFYVGQGQRPPAEMLRRDLLCYSRRLFCINYPDNRCGCIAAYPGRSLCDCLLSQHLCFKGWHL